MGRKKAGRRQIRQGPSTRHQLAPRRLAVLRLLR